MAIPPFTAGEPQNGQSLGNSKANIRNNLDGLFLTVAKNHFNNNSGNAGKHQYIQLPTDVNPGGSTGANELLLYNGLDGILNNLYFIPPGKAVPSAGIQLTRNEAPISANNGFSWLPGGILIQWGVVAFPGAGTTAFNTTTAAIYSMSTTLIGNSSAENLVSIISTTPGSPGSFAWHFTGSSSYSGFFWIAIGK